MNLFELVKNATLVLIFVILLGAILIVIQAYWEELRDNRLVHKQARLDILSMEAKKEENR